jgi:hypothetical protein
MKIESHRDLTEEQAAPTLALITEISTMLTSLRHRLSS